MNIRTIGAILYWCEGSKREKDCRVEFVNSDPEMISLFMRYLRSKRIEEARIRARMAIHVQDDELGVQGLLEESNLPRRCQFHVHNCEKP